MRLRVSQSTACFSCLSVHIFPSLRRMFSELCTGHIFYALGTGRIFFPMLGTWCIFPALCTGVIFFPCALHQALVFLHLSPRFSCLASIACFPVLGTGAFFCFEFCDDRFIVLFCQRSVWLCNYLVSFIRKPLNSIQLHYISVITFDKFSANKTLGQENIKSKLTHYNLKFIPCKVKVKSYYEPSGPSGRSLSPVSVA